MSVIELMHRLSSRIKSYFIERGTPVGLLWLAIALGAAILPPSLAAMFTGHETVRDIPLSEFVDQRLMLLFGLGLATLLFIFSAVKRAIAYGVKEQRNEDNFVAKVWDEISSASTHIACGMVAIWVSPRVESGSFPWLSLAYVGLGVFAFKGKTKRS